MPGGSVGPPGMASCKYCSFDGATPEELAEHYRTEHTEESTDGGT